MHPVTKLEEVQETGVANRVLDNQTAMGLSTLDGRIEVLERQGAFLLDRQEQDNNAWTNVSYGLKTDIQEVEEHFNTCLDLLRLSQQSLCQNFNEAHHEMVEAVRAHFYGPFSTLYSQQPHTRSTSFSSLHDLRPTPRSIARQKLLLLKRVQGKQLDTISPLLIAHNTIQQPISGKG